MSGKRAPDGTFLAELAAPRLLRSVLTEGLSRVGVDAGGGIKGLSLTPMGTPHPAPVDRFSESTVFYSLVSRCRCAFSPCCLLGLCPLLAFYASPPRHFRLFHVQDAGLGFGVSRYAFCAVYFPSALPRAKASGDPCFLLRSLTGFFDVGLVRRVPLNVPGIAVSRRLL